MKGEMGGTNDTKLMQELVDLQRQLIAALSPPGEFISFDEMGRRLRVSKQTATDIAEAEGLVIVVAPPGAGRKRPARSVYWPDVVQALRMRARREVLESTTNETHEAGVGHAPVILTSGLLG